MADKVVAIKIDVQGTADQKKKLEGLEKSLNTLTKARKRVNDQLKNGKITRDQYAKSMAQINLKLKGTRTELLKTRQQMLGLDSFTKKLGKSFSKLGTSVGAAFVGLFAAQKLFQVVSDGVNTIKDFEQQMAKVKAITGATNEEFQDLQASAKDLGSTTQFTASQVGQLQEEYAKLGFTTQEILDASEATLELATATGSDLAQSAKVAASTIKGFGLTAKDTQKVVDIMAKSFTSSALDINKFETAMSSVAPVAAAVGFSIEQTTASLGILTDAGFDASTAGTALRNILLDTQKAGISVTEAFRQVRESTDPATKALDLFGKRGAAVGLTLAKNEDKANAFAKSLENAGGAASAMARIVGDTLDGDLKRLSSAWEGLILNFSETDSLRDIVQFTTDLVSGISGLTKNVYEQSDAMEEQRATISVLVGRITSLNEGTEDRKKLINELNAISPDFLKGLDQENLKNETLAKRLKTVNDQLVNKIIIQRKTDEIDAQAEKTTDKKIANREALIELEKRLDERKAKGAKSIERARKGELSRLLTTQDAVDNFIKSEEKRQAIYTDFNKSTVQRAQAINALSKAEKTASIFSKNLNALISKAFLAEQELNDEKKKSEVLISERIKLEEELGITTEKSTDADKAAAAAALKAANANKELGKSFKFIAEELEDLDDDNEKFEENFVDINKGKEESQQAFFDFIDEGYQESFDLNQKLLDQDVEAFGKSLLDKQKLEEDNEKQKAIIKQELIKGGIEVANAAATALVDVAGRKAEREKDIELSNLDAKLENGLITQEEFESKKLEIEKKAFKQKKKLELANIAIALATEIASIQAAAAANPLNAVTFGGAGLTQSSVLTGIAIAKSAVQAGIVASQSFAEGGYTGGGVGTPDATGFRQAGVVHEGEYVVPKNVLESNGGSRLVGALESMRNNRPQPYLGAGFANGGFSSGGSGLDLTDMENRISKAVTNSIGSIQVVNVATETTTQANRVNNIQSEATFG